MVEREGCRFDFRLSWLLSWADVAHDNFGDIVDFELVTAITYEAQMLFKFLNFSCFLRRMKAGVDFPHAAFIISNTFTIMMHRIRASKLDWNLAWPLHSVWKH
jgi:hypothetical protein